MYYRPVLNGFEASWFCPERRGWLQTLIAILDLAGTRIRELERSEGRPACTIVAVTALSRPEDIKRGIEEQVGCVPWPKCGLLTACSQLFDRCGMDSWLTKPVARATLIAELALRL
jgi:CheY-like chemotaxis protein